MKKIIATLIIPTCILLIILIASPRSYNRGRLQAIQRGGRSLILEDTQEGNCIAFFDVSTNKVRKYTYAGSIECPEEE